MIRNIIFDWSGTLVDDLPAVLRATNHVFRQAGREELSLDQFRAGNVFPTANVLAALAARTGKRPRVLLMSSQAAADPLRRSRRRSRRPIGPCPSRPMGAASCRRSRR